MPDFSIPLSGLTAESTALSAIANNLSNQSTTGYKDTQVQFSDLFYQSLGTTGSGDPIQVGAGTEVSGMPSLFTQGDISATGVQAASSITRAPAIFRSMPTTTWSPQTGSKCWAILR
jgi:flagellar hook protein FlgE